MKNPILFILLLCAVVNLQAQVEVTQPNIIYIVIDDLNDYIEPYYGHPQVKTPNIKSIADSGTVFLNAFASSPVCAASRASIFTGKDAAYTGLLNNQDIDCGDYRASFIPGNYIITLPQYLKDSAGYFTSGYGKIFHCDAASNEYDTETADVCSKTKSWNKFITPQQGAGVHAAAEATDEDITQFKWSKLDSSFESSLEDYIATDSVLQTIDDYVLHPELFCNRPLFMSIGYHLPHLPMYVTENYYPEYYQDNIYEEPFDKPYNFPFNAFPYNGIVMPPQPKIAWDDYDHLGELGKNFAGPYIHNGFLSNCETIDPLPIIEYGISDEERMEILAESKRANAIMAYIASIQFIDAQVGRVLEKLKENPALYYNTIIIISSDHGYSLGEKKHWAKRALWETDIRVPLIITDNRNMLSQVCNSAVNLIDLFPTICEFAEISEPVFPDGGDYLDGNSLTPFLLQPELNIERPVLSTIRHESGEESSCFPQYSVRNNKFHYIRYRSNNAEEGPDCDFANSYTEDELYKIGKKREGDPNEWNNLINNEEYQSVLHYLQQWLPDSSKYLQSAFTVKIHNRTLPCFLPNNGNLKLIPIVYNEQGVIMTGDELDLYTFKWTNSLNDEVFFGKTYIFDMASILPEIFVLNDEMLINVEVTETATGSLMGFNNKIIYINSLNTPAVSFDIHTNEIENSVEIIDYEISGNYTNSYWEFGDGISSEEYWPATHFYSVPSSYTISNYIEYGNGCEMNVDQTIEIFRQGLDLAGYTIYPNPASEKVTIALEKAETSVEIQIINMLGQTIFDSNVIPEGNLIYLDIEKIHAGSYILKLNTESTSACKIIEII